MNSKFEGQVKVHGKLVYGKLPFHSELRNLKANFLFHFELQKLVVQIPFPFRVLKLMGKSPFHSKLLINVHAY